MNKKSFMEDNGNDFHNAGQGMQMTKMVNGKPTMRHAIKADAIARMELIIDMDRRRKRYIVEQDWKNLTKLADEYLALGALTMAGEVRREIPT